jgi:hypothetical protein
VDAWKLAGERFQLPEHDQGEGPAAEPPPDADDDDDSVGDEGEKP